MLNYSTARILLLTVILGMIFMTCGVLGVAIAQHQGWVLPVLCIVNLVIWIKFYLNVKAL